MSKKDGTVPKQPTQPPKGRVSETRERGISKAQQFLKKTIYNKKMRYEELSLNLYPYGRKMKEIPSMVEEIIQRVVYDAPEIKRICFETGYGHTPVAIQIRKALGKHLMQQMNYLMETSGNPGTFKMLDDIANRVIVYPKLAYEQNNEYGGQRYGYRRGNNDNDEDEEEDEEENEQEEQEKDNVGQNKSSMAPNPNSKSQIKKRYKLQNKNREKQRKKEQKEKEEEGEERENDRTNFNDNDHDYENEKEEEEMLGSFLWQMQSLTVADADENGENKKLDRLYNIPARYFKPKKKNNEENRQNQNQASRQQQYNSQRKPSQGQNTNTQYWADTNCYNMKEQQRILEEIKNQHSATQQSLMTYHDEQSNKNWVDINTVDIREQRNILQSIHGQPKKSNANRANNSVAQHRNGNQMPSYWETERDYDSKQNKNTTMQTTHNFFKENTLEKQKNKNKNKKKNKPKPQQPQPQPQRVNKVSQPPASKYRETTIPNTNIINPAWIEYLTGMGFDANVARHAIVATNYVGMNAALDYLLTCSK